jgi:ornithine cyclodeaminase/alanine dehydrogenase-like protein (mu-crystallin family)
MAHAHIPLPPLVESEAVKQVLHYGDLIESMAEALKRFSERSVVQPVRSVVPVDEHQGFMCVMPAYRCVGLRLLWHFSWCMAHATCFCTSGTALGVKIVLFYPQNKEIPSHMATILL